MITISAGAYQFVDLRRVINHVIIRQLTRSSPAMGKRKVKKNNNFTKIDPSTLKSKPQAVSQHAANDGKRVTTTINPPPPPPPLDPNALDRDLGNFSEENLGDESGDDEMAREYYASQVRSLHCLLLSTRGSSLLPGQHAPAIYG